MNVGLMIIDAQKDFADDGALPVPGTYAASDRIATMLDRIGPELDDIHVTLDCHHRYHVAHPMAWKDANGNPPAPYTPVALDDVTGKSPTLYPAVLAHADKLVKYIEDLSASGRYGHMIWPEHCLIGTEGNVLIPQIWEALKKWEGDVKGWTTKTTKGSNPFTEHFSAVRAQVPNEDMSTHVNPDFIDWFTHYDKVAWAGFADEFCLANTFRDTIAELGNEAAKRMVYLEDATAQTGVAQPLVDAWHDEIGKLGVEITTTDKFLK